MGQPRGCGPATWWLAPDRELLKGKRDRALLAVLLSGADGHAPSAGGAFI
jgi:hypothetical protein